MFKHQLQIPPKKHLNSQSNQKHPYYKMSSKYHKPSAQEKRLTAIQEKFESHLEKIGETVANIEYCQNQNTKTLQQNIVNLKNELLSKNEIITTSINKQTDLLEKCKSHAIIQKSPYNQRSQEDNLHKS